MQLKFVYYNHTGKTMHDHDKFNYESPMNEHIPMAEGSTMVCYSFQNGVVGDKATTMEL